MLECVANISEGRDETVLAKLAASCGEALLDLHRDPDHHRAVMTLAGPSEMVEAASRQLAAAAVTDLDLRAHRGSHPRFGVIDVVPFVPLRVGAPNSAPSAGPGAGLGEAVQARDHFARWAGMELDLPCFLYGPLPGGGERRLPQVRRMAFTTLTPDTGPPRPHPTAGATAVGARPVLVAYNLWVAGGDAALARSVATAIRGPKVRALGFDLGGRPQVSCNLIDPSVVGPAAVYDRVAARLEAAGAGVDHAELVGLVPDAVLRAVPEHRWPEVGLNPDATIEARLAAQR